MKKDLPKGPLMMTSYVAALSAFLLASIPSLADKPPKVVDDAAPAGIYEVTETWGATVADFDDDGWQDWLLIRDGGPGTRHSLYHNDQGRFTEIDVGTFRGADLHDCPWADVNGDDMLDVFCSNGANVGTETKLNELWIQQSDHTFFNEVSEYGLDDDIYGRGRASAFIDADHDAYPDLFVGNLYPREDSHPSPNRFYINENGTRYRAAPDYGLDGENGASCAEAGDYDGDGWDDLLVCGKTRMLLFHNNQGESFTEVSRSVNVYGFWRDGVFADFDGDGLLDILRVRRESVQVRLQENGRFVPHIDISLTDGVALAVADVNGDELLDVYVVQACGSGSTNLPDMMLANDGSGGVDEMDVPTTTEGCGNMAAPIDFDNNGASDFIVLNGWMRRPGPVQLISFPEPRG